MNLSKIYIDLTGRGRIGVEMSKEKNTNTVKETTTVEKEQVGVSAVNPKVGQAPSQGDFDNVEMPKLSEGYHNPYDVTMIESLTAELARTASTIQALSEEISHKDSELVANEEVMQGASETILSLQNQIDELKAREDKMREEIERDLIAEEIKGAQEFTKKMKADAEAEAEQLKAGIINSAEERANKILEEADKKRDQAVKELEEAVQARDLAVADLHRIYENVGLVLVGKELTVKPEEIAPQPQVEVKEPVAETNAETSDVKPKQEEPKSRKGKPQKGQPKRDVDPAWETFQTKPIQPLDPALIHKPTSEVRDGLSKLIQTPDKNK